MWQYHYVVRTLPNCYSNVGGLCRYSEGLWQLPNGGLSHSQPAAGSGGAAGSSMAAVAPLMLKVKDWPPKQDFCKELPRHFMVSALPTRGW